MFLLRLRAGMTVGIPEGSRNRNSMKITGIWKKEAAASHAAQLKLAPSTRRVARMLLECDDCNQRVIWECIYADDNWWPRSKGFDKENLHSFWQGLRYNPWWPVKVFPMYMRSTPTEIPNSIKIVIYRKICKRCMYNSHQFTSPSQSISLLHHSS